MLTCQATARTSPDFRRLAPTRLRWPGAAVAGDDTECLQPCREERGYGTPFDLSDLLSDPLVLSGAVDLNNIQYVKLVDIPGNGSFLDSQGHQS